VAPIFVVIVCQRSAERRSVLLIRDIHGQRLAIGTGRHPGHADNFTVPFVRFLENILAYSFAETLVMPGSPLNGASLPSNFAVYDCPVGAVIFFVSTSPLKVTFIPLSDKLSVFVYRQEPDRACAPDGPLPTRVASPLACNWFSAGGVITEFHGGCFSVGGHYRFDCCHSLAVLLVGNFDGPIIHDAYSNSDVIGMTADFLILAISIDIHGRNASTAVIRAILQ
jgi:hypothetical protein